MSAQQLRFSRLIVKGRKPNGNATLSWQSDYWLALLPPAWAKSPATTITSFFGSICLRNAATISSAVFGSQQAFPICWNICVAMGNACCEPKVLQPISLPSSSPEKISLPVLAFFTG